MSQIFRIQSDEKDLILSVSEITNAIKQSLEASFPHVTIQGEVSNCKLHSSGHFYFSLKDTHAQIACVMYRRDASQLSKKPKDGDQLILKGCINVYPPSGKYQLTVKELQYAGVGALLLKLEDLKKKIKKLGWFDQNHKKPIPKIPKKIGVITSPTGAAIQDILNVLSRRFSAFHLLLYPVKVQGDGAAKEIAQAIQELNHYQLVDVMIVGRGGGSIEDLWAFNEEIVAEAIFKSKIPIIAAVGHETDHCIAEYVADLRAPTPSAAAEMVIQEKQAQTDKLITYQKQIYNILFHLFKGYSERLTRIRKNPAISTPYALIGPWMQKLDGLNSSLSHSIQQNLKHKRTLLDGRKKQHLALKPVQQILHFKQKLLTLDRTLRSLVERNISLYRERLVNIKQSLHAIDPKNLLKKGYSILFSEKDSSVITSCHGLRENQKIHALIADGKILATINSIENHEHKSTKRKKRS